MKGQFNRELFEYIEKKGSVGVTSREIAERMWVARSYARVWLSKYTNYRNPNGKARHYLKYNPPPPGSIRGGKDRVLGTYTIGPDPWTELTRANPL